MSYKTGREPMEEGVLVTATLNIMNEIFDRDGFIVVIELDFDVTKDRTKLSEGSGVG